MIVYILVLLSMNRFVTNDYRLYFDPKSVCSSQQALSAKTEIFVVDLKNKSVQQVACRIVPVEVYPVDSK